MRRARAPAGAQPDAVAALAESLAVLLDAGLPPRSAWEAAAGYGAHPLADRVANALRHQPSCASALAQAADTDDVRMLAVAWRVAERTGAPLGHTLRAMAETLRDAAETEREVDVALSGPRATARLVSWLPAVGAVLAGALGADLAGALGSVPGTTSVGAGVLLMLAGRWWMRALVTRAVARPLPQGLAEELIAVGLAGGVSIGAAREIVREAAEESGLGSLDERGAARVLRLASAAGAPAGELLTAAARQQRRMARAEGRRRATTLGVRLMVPLGACVLPSFLLLAVAPLVLSLLSSTTAGLR
ncbi:tight adherence protein B [Leifsonia sp. 98AMF]|uniref:type II secretion system F family protein n=1 Tax=unclassified Leifsonia TaxID=2663824 RepID=UPI00087ABF93|nr:MULTISPECIES: type II secretion system F family protein [unclassified Leifsonia]SDH15573.1 tight adherence protein B [Leifsonia sp. 197AMF]SDJ22670.1 tight adherence protein B [Leifsonia sp. 466MF]SDK61001.1 tight adherence protein B [Leifsonia sp. 157MF]SDN44351.1 tight adherence protein B [Leifsonia sp. 509MF]SEN66663.1 tight adherence protein B [Leifsonia sp. 467MF]